MPTQDNCEDLKVESCVDENGQTINGGDSYDVPTGRYVKHVVNVCGSGGAAAGIETRACPNGGLEETWNGPEDVCLSIKTEPDAALVLDNGVLKIDSTKLKVTSDNVLPAGSDPGLLSAGPYFTDPDGNVWNNQSDYNKWLYEEQKRQDGEIDELKEATDGLDDLYVEVAGDTMTGDLVVEANVEAEQVISRVIDSGENSNLELKHDGSTKVYVGKEQLTSQEKLKLNKEGTEDYHAVTKGYIDTDQKRQDEALQEEINARAERDILHDAQLSTIEYKLDQLVGLQFKGIYEFKHEADCNRDYELCIQNCMSVDPDDTECRTMCGQTAMDCERDKVRPGYFEAVDPDDQFDHLQYIVISKADKAGVEIEWANVLKKDDYLEVDHTADGVLDKTNYGLYRIIEDPVESQNAYGEEVYTMRLEFLQGDGVMNVRENYEIRGITAAEGVNPEELGDFLTKDEANTLYSLKTHAHAWADITGKPSTYPPNSHTHNYASSNHTHSGYASSNHTHSGYASSSHNHNSDYVKGNYTISYSSGSYYIS